MNTVLDITRHPYDPASILDWALGLWELDSSLPLLVITEGGDGVALDNRLRVKLSEVRRRLKMAKTSGVKQFGIESTIIPWTTKEGITYDGLCLNRKIQGRHIASEAFDEVMRGVTQ